MLPLSLSPRLIVALSNSAACVKFFLRIMHGTLRECVSERGTTHLSLIYRHKNATAGKS